MSIYIGALKPGEYSTNTQHQVDLGLTTNIGGCDFRMCQVNSVAIAAAGGSIVDRLFSLGVPTNKITLTVTAGSLNVAGGIPIANSAAIGFAVSGGPLAISSATTIPASAFLLVQFTGPGTVAANVTIVSPAAFAASATSAATSVDTSTGSLFGYLGRVTNTAVNTVAAAATTCIWSLPA